jgi:hypothetical protein
MGLWARFRESLDDEDADGFLLGEVPVYVNYANWEKAGFIVECVPGALVDVNRSMGREAVQDPEVAVADGMGYWEEACV